MDQLSHMAGAKGVASSRNTKAGGRRSSVAIPMAPPTILGRSRPGSPDGGSSIAGSMSSGKSRGTTPGSPGSPASVSSEQAKLNNADKPFRHPEGTYEGESNINLVPHGYGTYYYKNGDVFAGNWQNGIREGEGCMTYTTNERYIGNYNHSLANLEGRYEFKNGDLYVGEFKDGVMYGLGVYTYRNGDIYKGKFRKGTKCDVNGEFTYANGDKYIGRFHQNVPYGRGKLFLHKQLVPKEVWNGKLIETDPRPSKNGSYTNFHDEDDIPIIYNDREDEDNTSSSESENEDDDGSEESSRISHRSQHSQVSQYSIIGK